MSNQNPQPPADGPGPYGQPAYGRPAYDAGPGSRFGTAAYGQDGQYGTVSEPKRFRTLLTLTLVSAAVWVLSSLPDLLGGGLSTDGLRRQIEAGGQTVDAETEKILSVMGPMMVGGVVVSLLVGLGLYALVYFGLRAVKNWARILGIVLAILSALSSLVGILMSLAAGDILGALLTIVFLAVTVLWLVHAFHPQVAAYTRQGRRLTA